MVVKTFQMKNLLKTKYKANLVRNIIHQNSHSNTDSRLFGGSNLDTTGGTEDTLDVTVDGELTGSDGTNLLRPLAY